MNKEAMLWLELTILSLALVGLWKLYCQYQIDRLRQDLFAIRDKFFAQAAEGRIGFGTAAYRTTRLTLNGMIRFAHELGFLRLIVSIFSNAYILHVPEDRYQQHLVATLKLLPNKGARELVLAAHRDMHARVLEHFMKTSPVFAIFSIGFALAISARRGFVGLRKRLEGVTSIKRLDTEAYDIGLAAAGGHAIAC